MLSHEEEKFRSSLAYKRTELARDRTSLALIRTSLSFILAGAGFIGFSDSVSWFLVIGVSSIFVGIIFLSATIVHFAKHTKELKRVLR
tara:strand:- start:601 stop:864 length:264 start_codon:yes stop_codon:yes gene_type:complete